MQRKTFILTGAVTLLACLALGRLQAADKTVATPKPTPEPKKVATPVATLSATPATTPAAREAEKVDSSKASDVSKTAEVYHKSPVLAGTLAFFPGIVIHGVGHMYAGSWIKGLGLFAIEGAGVGVLAYQISNGANDIKNMFNSNDSSIPVDISPATSRIGIVIVATAAFLFTWWDDMSGAPIAAQEYNKRADQEASRAELNLLPVNGGAQLVYTAKF